MSFEELRRLAAEVEGHADALHGRRSSLVTEVRHLRWEGPRRDVFVHECLDATAARSSATVNDLRLLARELRALADEAEERLAALRRIETAVRAELARLLALARSVLRAIEDELRIASLAVGLVPGLEGIEVRLAAARRHVARLELFVAQLPPTEDLRWEAIGAQVLRGALR